jgi:hypothetical protein
MPHHFRPRRIWMEWSWRLTAAGRHYALRSYKSHWNHHRRVVPHLRPREREEHFLSVQQFADFLKLPTEYVRRLVRRGQINLVCVDLAFWIPKADLYAYCRARKRRHGTVLTVIDGARDRHDQQATSNDLTTDSEYTQPFLPVLS